jgi:hypothetical protein
VSAWLFTQNIFVTYCGAVRKLALLDAANVPAGVA